MKIEEENNIEKEDECEFEELEIPSDEDNQRESTKGGKTKSFPIKKTSKWKKIVNEGLAVPFRSIHSEPCSFKTIGRKCFMPGCPITAKILSIERASSTHYLLNPNLYIIQVQHGHHVWIIKRRYKHFQHLHQQLQLFRVTMIVPMPTKTHRERRTNYRLDLSSSDGGQTSRALPRFPKKPEALLGSDQLDERKNALEKYLQDLLKIRAYRNHHETLEFLDVSHLSFVQGLGDKGKEGLIKKRTGTAQTRRIGFRYCACFNSLCSRIQRCFGNCSAHWQKRWLIAKETFIAYVRPKDGRLHCVMLVDTEFEVSSGRFDNSVKNGIVISNLSRDLVVKCWTKRKAKEWLDHVRKLPYSEHAKCFIGPNRFTSFAPVRTSIEGKWFVDGSSYMSAVADALENATEEIFIADWWLSPEIYMKRPIFEGEKWRLDKILQRKAKEGVKVFVLLYKEVNLALGINSFYSKQKLVEKNSENIKVLRHPDHVTAGVFLWAHHEKLVIVDQSIAFVGGIDLCYGRWDDHIHRLTDLGSVSANAKKIPGAYTKKMTSSNPYGGDVPLSLLHLAKVTNTLSIGPLVSSSSQQQINSEAVEGEILNVLDTEGNLVKEAEVEREIEKLVMSEVNMGYEEDDNEDDEDIKLKGETPPTKRRLIRSVTRVTKEIRDATRDLRDDGKDWVHRHLRRRESKDCGEGGTTVADDEDVENNPSTARSSSRERKKHKVKDAVSANDEKERKDKEIGLQGSAKLWIGKDYCNFIVKDFTDLESPFTDLVDRSTTPRMPWHDLALMVHGAAARDAARHFIQRWNAVKDEKVSLNHSYPYLLPKCYEEKPDTKPEDTYTISCQVVRSLCQWSGGISMIEESIHQAYVELIEKSEYYIYIENQFFVSLAGSNSTVINRIGEALLQRILRAHREKKPLRIFVIMPLLPGFEGEVGTNRGLAIHAITHWNYSSISRGENSLISKLEKNGVDNPLDYLSFHGLRTYSELNEDLVTELIYVHSKLMIIDDNTVICGSANINDRSLTGKRDSEVCLVIQDETFVESKMNGVKYNAGQFARSLRLRLFSEHLGVTDTNDIIDPISDRFWNDIWKNTSNTNTEVFEKVFHCVPSDSCLSFVQMHEYQKEHPLTITDPASANKLLTENIKGHLVNLPLLFLQEENLLPSTGTKEGMMPTYLWT